MRWVLAVAALIAVPLRSQQPVGPPLPVILHHADSFVGSQTDSGEVRELTGNVWLQQGNVVLRCQRAIQNLHTGRIELAGNVRIEQEELQIWAPRILYDPTTAVATALEGAQLQQRSQRIRARSVRYELARRELLFFGSVVYSDDSLQLWTDTLRYARTSGAVLVWGGGYVERLPGWAAEADTLEYLPQMGRIRLAGAATIQRHGDTLRQWGLRAEHILLQRDSLQWLAARGGVELLGDTVWAARAAELQWQDAPQERLRLWGDPFVWYGTAELRADTVVASMRSDTLQELRAWGSARLRVLLDSSEWMHQLQADTVVVLPSDTVRQLCGNGAARSVYVHRDADGRFRGLFRVGADRIRLGFAADTLRWVRWLSMVYGEYVPQELVGENLSAWVLKGFQWHSARPQPIAWRYKRRWVP